MGRPKQLEVFDGVTLVRRAVLAAKEVGQAIIVVGARHEQVEAELTDLNVAVVYNERWGEGMGASISVAMAAVSSSDAVLLTVCDQPQVDGQVLARIVAAHMATSADIVAAAYDGTLGVPALFSRKHFSELAALEGDRGAKAIIRRYGAVGVECPEAAWDIDEETDLKRYSNQ